MTFTLDRFDLDAFVASTLAEDLGEIGDITSAAVIPADAMFSGVMDSRMMWLPRGFRWPKPFSGRWTPTWRSKLSFEMATMLKPEQMRSEEHTSELQSLMRISYAVFCLKKKKTQKTVK